jgi:tripartite-type tricarboxylate transporter receptor subunit TctC
MQARDVQERFAKQGVVIAVNTPEQFDKIIKDDARRYAEVFKDAAAAN